MEEANMKFLHMADMHFDSPFTLLNSKGDFGKIRRLEQREIFQKIIQYIKENQIEYLLIAGDFYEHEYIGKSTIEYINGLFQTIPETKIFITPGNHDPYLKNSMYATFPWSANVKIFSSTIEVVETPEADIYGVGFDDFSCDNLGVENIQIKNQNKINILITHGTLDGSSQTELPYNMMKKNNLKKLGFDYIALGHIHKPDYNSEENQTIIYPGSTISRGFDELGQHGAIVGNIEKNYLQIKFVPMDNREFQELLFPINDILDMETLEQKINELNLENNILYKIILTGKRKFEISISTLNKLIDQKNIIKIKDETEPDIDIEAFANETTLKGIFVKEILEEMKKNTENKEMQEQLEKALEIGLSILDKS